ncbi:hypothetical protein JCM3765_001226 [Sporobolomyces pararoseus]
MSYQTFTDAPQTAEFLSNIPTRNHQERPSPLRCFLQTTAIFLVLFLIAISASLVVDKTVPKRFSISRSIDNTQGLHRRVLQLERRMMEMEKRAELDDWVKLAEDEDKED